MNILLGILTFVLILISIFLILVVLAQKAKSDGGMGAAMGGGMAEATFGAETSNVLSKATINAAIAFFVLSCALFLGRIYQLRHTAESGAALPSIGAPAGPRTLPAFPPASTPPGKTGGTP
jgi:preprotein translocase subunit SecG